jgi:serine/threonine-protein kinase
MTFLDLSILAATALFAPLPAALWGLRRAAAARSRYRLLEVLGEGGMGTVRRGWDAVGRRPVAVKRLRRELRAEPRQHERLLEEAAAVAALRHPNVVALRDVVVDEDGAQLVFEFVAGRTLHAELDAAPGRRLPPARALGVLGQAAAAVDHAHARGVIHRDLKPANLMIDAGGRVKVLDFGVARLARDARRVIVGTPAYRAPEQERGDDAPASDQYALAASFYEMLCGEPPFPGEGGLEAKLASRFTPPSALRPELSPELDAVLARALHPRPARRFPSARALHLAAADAVKTW